MLLTETAQYLIDRNGGYILGDLDDLSWNLTSFWRVMKNEIDRYQSYVPLKKEFNISNKTALVYDFTYDSHNVGYEGVNTPGEPPREVVSAVPLLSGSLLTSLPGHFVAMNRHLHETIDPRKFIKDYRKPKLYLTETGVFDVRCHYDYQVIITEGSGTISEVEIPDIEKDPLHPVLMDLLSGRFLMAVARSRRAFTYNEMPITTDADQLYKEGEEEYNAALQKLYDQHDWFDVIGA